MEILYTLKLNQNIVEFLNEVGNVTYIERKDLTKDDVKNKEIIIGNIPIDLLPYCDELKYLQLESAGSDDYAKVLDDSIILCNSSGTFGKTISEHVIMLILMLQRHMVQFMHMQENKEFYRIGKEELLYKSTAVILGCGDIGIEVAKRLKAFDVYTIGLKRTCVDSIQYFDEVYTMECFEDCIKKADVIICCLPKNDESDLLFDKKHLEMLKESCLFINVGRGNIVDEQALVRCLEENIIKGAALDVFMEEPLPKNSPIYTCKNLIVTPHVAGTFASSKTKDIFCDIVYENVNHYLKQEKMANEVNRKTGYRELNGRIQK